MKPIYDITRSYEENVARGPQFDGPLPERQWPDPGEWIDFLGTPVASRIGVPAGPLLTAEWVEFAANLGYDTLVYKTARSAPFPAHAPPNMLYLETPLKAPVVARESAPETLDELAVTNSFGNPTLSDAFLEEDIPRAMAACHPGQAFVASIVGVPPDMPHDFCRAAARMRDLGAPIIEANFSCPNVSSADGALYQSPDDFLAIASRLVATLGETPLIIKMGLIEDDALLRDVALAAARSGVRALAAINTVKGEVIDRQGRPALGPDRPTSGICGAPIREPALAFIRRLRHIIDTEKLDLTLIGMGGITAPKHFDKFLAYADFAQVAAGMMWDPLLAMRYHNGKRCTDSETARDRSGQVRPVPA